MGNRTNTEIDMTQEDKNRLKEILFQKKAITYDGYLGENPFIGIYLNELIEALKEYGTII